MEFQMGLRPSTTPSFELCDNSHFLQRTWNTQAREFSFDIYFTHIYYSFFVFVYNVINVILRIICLLKYKLVFFLDFIFNT